VLSGKFRQDLYYRLNVIQIRVPPLRERLEDLATISERVLERIARDANVSPAPRLTRDAMVHLMRYPFPGNVRELENLLHRAVALSSGEAIDVFDLGLPETVFTDSAAQELDLITENTRVDPAIFAPEPPPPPPAAAPLPDDLAPTSTKSSATSCCARWSAIASTARAAGASLGLSLRQMRYRMARLGVSVGSDSFNDERGG
jgi:two-component system response regulator PilR (NtrC family)